MAECKEFEMTLLAYHGTDRMDFDCFDIAEARIFNLGLHFGTKAAAKAASPTCARRIRRRTAAFSRAS